MTRTITRHEFLSGTGDPVYTFTVHCHSAAEREGLEARVRAAADTEVPPAPRLAPPPCDGPPSGYAEVTPAEILIEMTEGDA